MKIRIGLITLLVLFVVTSYSRAAAPEGLATAIPQATPEKPLDAGAVSELVDELKEGLSGLIGDEEQVTAITEKWDEHEDLAGKTKVQILNLLLADVKAIVEDKKVQNRVWSAWQSAEPENKGVVATPTTSPTRPKGYVAQMTELITQLDSWKTGDELVSLSRQFEAIGVAQKTEWLPYYYSAYALVTKTLQMNDVKAIDVKNGVRPAILRFFEIM